MTVDSQLVSSIGKGLLVFAGIGKEDTEKDAENLVTKTKSTKTSCVAERSAGSNVSILVMPCCGYK